MSLHLEISQGLRVDNLLELQNKVNLRGGCLIAYSEVISALLLSARSYKVKWVAAPEERKRAGVPSTIVTLILGWWAFAGPYRSFSALIWNRRGGFDVTDALLRAYPGNKTLLTYSEAASMSDFQDSVGRPARRICAILLVMLLGAVAYAVWWASRK